MKPSTMNPLSKGKTIYHGVRDGIELDEIYSRSNVAISTLALHLKNLKEAASLKTREYTARGIPFILAYDDPDLAEVDEQRKFFLRFPNDNEILIIDRIVDFLVRIAKGYNKPNELSQYMREYAYRKMDWGVKMKKYVEFCSQV